MSEEPEILALAALMRETHEAVEESRAQRKAGGHAVNAQERASAFIVFCDGLEEGGLGEYARWGRLLARELLEALEALDAERSARVAIQEARDRAVELLGKRADDALRQFIESDLVTHTRHTQRGVGA